MSDKPVWTDGWVEPNPYPICAVCGAVASFHRIDLKKVVGKDGHEYVHGGDKWVAHASVVLPVGQRPKGPFSA